MKFLEPPNQWVALNKILYVYKAIGVTLGVICLSLSLLSIYLATKPPVVVIQRDQKRTFHYPTKRGVEISQEDVSSFISDYIQLRYTWEELDSEVILKNISPLTTRGFQRKVKARLDKESGGKGLNKKISQQVTYIQPVVTEKEASVSFDRIIRIEGTPLIAPAQATFQIIKGRATAWNPMGLYVNGVIINEGGQK